MASFDPHVMFEMPLDFATRCFADVYRGFRLRGWVQDTSEQTCRDEYIGVLTHLRGSRVSLTSSTSALHDIVDFLSNLPTLRERGHIYHLFKLSCLCLTDKSSTLPIVRFGAGNTDVLNCRSTDVILPVQSILANLPYSVPVCTSDSALEDFKALTADFGVSGLDTNYDPWRSVDLFSRAKIHKRLSARYISLPASRAGPRRTKVRGLEGFSSEMAALRASRRVRTRQCFGSLIQSGVAQSVTSLRQCSSKD